MSEGTPPGGVDPITHLEFLKKFKRPKLLDLSSRLLGGLVFSFFLVSCLCLLAFGNTSGGYRLSFQPQSKDAWFALNLSPSVESRRVGFLEELDGGCDIFDGDWVWDETYPLYHSKDCPFLDAGFRCLENGRPDDFFTKWRWQPKYCDLPRFDARVMLERLRNRRVVFVGDSIGRNQWESLLCMLSSAIGNKTSVYEVNGSPITKHSGFLVFRFRDFNCTIEYYRSPFLVPVSRAPAGVPEKVKTTLKVDRLDWSSSQWKDADVLVFNSGHWWNNEKTIRLGSYFQEGEKVKMEMGVLDAYRRSIETLVDWIGKEVNASKTRVFFRSYAPVHFSGGDWKTGGSCHKTSHPEFSSSHHSPENWVQFKIVLDVLSGCLNNSETRKLDLINVTAMTWVRRDGHSSVYYLGPKKGLAPLHRQDCSHWCLPGVPDAWNELLLASLLKSDNFPAARLRKPHDL